MFGMEPQGLAAVDKSPDRRRLRPANMSKVGAETSSLHIMQSFKAHSGAGPLLGTVDDSVSVPFVSLEEEEEKNRFFRVAGRSYHFSDEVSDSVELVSISFPLSPPNCGKGKVGLRTHEPKHFFAVLEKKRKTQNMSFN